MIGREAYQNPYMLAQVDSRLFQDSAPTPERDAIAARLLPYIERELERGARLNHITRHILGLYQNVPGARKFRRHLSENAYKPDVGIEVLEDALALVSQTQDA
jgi:tRNA-dihydrouridine synthase A